MKTILFFRLFFAISCLFFALIFLQNCFFSQKIDKNITKKIETTNNYENFNEKQLKNIQKTLKTPPHFGENFYLPTNNLPDEDVIALGKKLFFDVRLSSNDKISCASCHQPQKAFTDGLPTAKGFNNVDLHRNTMSLVNLLWQKQFFWDARVSSLEEQVLHPLENPLEMNITREDLVKKLKNIPEYEILFKKAFSKKKFLKNNSDKEELPKHKKIGYSFINIENVTKAIAQFERTLISANSRYDKIVQGKIVPTQEEQRAIQLFFTHPIASAGIRGGNCGDCHGSHLTQLNGMHNNGLDEIYKDLGVGYFTKKIMDNGKMKAPSLRNIALTAPYMHDGRFQTLEQVLDHYNEHIKFSPALDPLIIEATNEIDGNTLKLTPQEKKDIILFLKMLTDSSFVKM